jgi:hypothetical protein
MKWSIFSYAFHLYIFGEVFIQIFCKCLICCLIWGIKISDFIYLDPLLHKWCVNICSQLVACLTISLTVSFTEQRFLALLRPNFLNISWKGYVFFYVFTYIITSWLLYLCNNFDCMSPSNLFFFFSIVLFRMSCICSYSLQTFKLLILFAIILTLQIMLGQVNILAVLTLLMTMWYLFIYLTLMWFF